MKLPEARDVFANPPVEVRPTPFWFWNDRLDPERLKGQFDKFLDAGMGGAVLHARHGLDAEEYLDERWFNAIGAVVEHAHARGAYSWLYDELGWPSGTAGGRVPREHPEFRMLHLRMADVVLRDPSEVVELPGEVVAAFHVTHTDADNGHQLRHDGSVTLLPDRIRYTPIERPFEPAEWVGNRVLVFRSAPYDGAVNYLDRRATEAFLESTHEEYFRRFGAHFGGAIRHIFMDEAGMNPQAAWLPWDGDFEEHFQTRWGYSLTPKLPALFFDVAGCETVRYHFWNLTATLFLENFGVPMHEWCSKHGVAYTGHYVFEATLKEATRQLGSVMPLYEFQGLPGIDILGNDFYSRRFEREAYGYYVVTVKQAASVSHQLGKGGLMSESHGVGGHAMGPEAMQTVCNFLMALGVTHMVQHAAFYSMRGDRKSDCPPAIGWQEPYWPFVRKHMDTISRTGWLLSQGDHVCNVLLLHPATSMQATYRHFRRKAEYKAENYLLDADLPFELIDKHFTLLSVALLDAQIDHDYGDEEIMARHASVAHGKLRVGRESYRLVVLPPLVNIRKTTLALLAAYAQQAGRIVTVGSVPRLVDGLPSNEAAEFLNAHAARIVDGAELFEYQTLVDSLTALGVRTVTVKTVDGEDIPTLKAQRRLWDDREILYLANIAREPVTAQFTFTPRVTGRVEEWDVSSGVSRAIAPCTAGQDLCLDLAWAAREARAFVFVPVDYHEATEMFTERRRAVCDWIGKRNHSNIVVLDECRIVEADVPGVAHSISQAQAVLRARVHADAGPLRLVTQYQVTLAGDGALRSPCELAVELGEQPVITVNGSALSCDSTEWFMDPAIRRILLPPLRVGENTIEISAAYRNATDLQSPFILGDFRLVTTDSASFTLHEDDRAIGVGSWTDAGLQFFAGTVTYRTSIDVSSDETYRQVLVDMPGLAGSAEARVNGAVVDHVLWPPYHCDITTALRPGANTIEIEVAGTLRNLLGPHFDAREEFHTGCDDSYYQCVVGQPKRFLDYGLLTAPEIVFLD